MFVSQLQGTSPWRRRASTEFRPLRFLKAKISKIQQSTRLRREPNRVVADQEFSSGLDRNKKERRTWNCRIKRTFEWLLLFKTAQLSKRMLQSDCHKQCKQCNQMNIRRDYLYDSCLNTILIKTSYKDHIFGRCFNREKQKSHLRRYRTWEAPNEVIGLRGRRGGGDTKNCNEHNRFSRRDVTKTVGGHKWPVLPEWDISCWRHFLFSGRWSTGGWRNTRLSCLHTQLPASLVNVF